MAALVGWLQSARLSQRKPVRGGRPRLAPGTVGVLLGAAAWGTAGTAAHFAPADASPASVGAARIALGGLLLLAVALATAGSRRAVAGLLSGGLVSRAVLLLAAAAVAGYQVCFFTAVRETGVAIGTVVAIGSAPVFTGALSRLTGGSRLGRRWVIATASAVAGCAVLISSGHPEGATAAGAATGGARPAGVSLALAAGLCYAIYAVTAARLISAGSPETAVMGLLFGAAAVLLSPLLAGQFAKLGPHWPRPRRYGLPGPRDHGPRLLVLRPRSANRGCPGGGYPRAGRAGGCGDSRARCAGRTANRSGGDRPGSGRPCPRHAGRRQTAWQCSGLGPERLGRGESPSWQPRPARQQPRGRPDSGPDSRALSADRTWASPP